MPVLAGDLQMQWKK